MYFIVYRYAIIAAATKCRYVPFTHVSQIQIVPMPRFPLGKEVSKRPSEKLKE